LAEARDGLRIYAEIGNRTYTPLFQSMLAELEAEGSSRDAALQHIDEALALARQTGERWTDSILQRIRGEILCKLHPDDSAPAEQAYLAAIAIAREQRARSFGLQAALKLTKLYQSTARSVEAHHILGVALEGFAQTPEMPDIAEGRALLAVLAPDRASLG
jgi:predicted ATPase